MFADCRSRKVLFVAHCLLNQNAISDGTALYPAAHQLLIEAILKAQVGIVQLPCPELCCLGLDRGDPLGASRPVVVENTRIRRELEKPGPARRMEALVEQTVDQIKEYARHGFEILGVVGVNRSPSCGVDTTSREDREVPGRGIFLEALELAMEKAGLTVPVVGVRGTPEDLPRVLALLEK